MRSRRLLALAIALSFVGSAACSAILGLEAPPEGVGDDASASGDTTTGDAAHDASTSDAIPLDAASDHDAAPDVAVDAPLCFALDAGDGSTTYNALRTFAIDDAGTQAWQFFEPNSVNVNARNFQGGVFDGRYVYLAPSATGAIARYDTHGGFSVGGSWSVFDATTVSPDAQQFSGAVYDGRYVYFVPHGAPSAGLMLRYDTHGPFAAGPAWSTYDLTTLPVADAGTLVGFSGASFDGRGVYLAPDFGPSGHLSRVVRYDTDAGDAGVADGGDAGDGAPPFATAAQFSTFDLTIKNNSAAGYSGSVFDGRYVYLAPFANDGTQIGLVARYDTTLAFGQGSSWLDYDLTAISADAVGFTGAAFDGRYVYLVPHDKSLVLRFDTQATGALGHAPSWSTFDIASIAPPDASILAFSGAGFDGRFVYFVPSSGAVNANATVYRYDTWSTFGSACAWSYFDVSQLVGGASDYFGAVYDGQYLYLVPRGTWVARFNTKSPGSMPALPGFTGSFF